MDCEQRAHALLFLACRCGTMHTCLHCSLKGMLALCCLCIGRRSSCFHQPAMSLQSLQCQQQAGETDAKGVAVSCLCADAHAGGLEGRARLQWLL